LRSTFSAGSRLVAVVAASGLSLLVAGPSLALPPGPAWSTDDLGSTAIFHMKTAPFPHAGRPYTDDRVLFFVPSGYRPGATVDVVVHYHGWYSEVVASDAAHHYREQLALSKKNAILLEPQGPKGAPDGSGGKHSDPGGMARFLEEAISLLVSERVLSQGTKVGTLLLSGHSGAYNVISDVLDHGGVEVSEVHLHDALYGQEPRFEAWAKQPRHKLVSTCTRNGGTLAKNDAFAQRLEADGVSVARDDSDASLASARAIFIHTSVSHGDVTHARRRWADFLEHSGLSDLGVPRPRLRSVRRATDGNVVVSWYPSRSKLCQGYRLSWSSDGAEPFQQILDETSLNAATTKVEVARTAGEAYFRLTAVDDSSSESAPSSIYAARPDGSNTPRVLVVDGFERTSGAWHELAHPFAAVVGRSVAASGRSFDECSTNAVRDGSVSLGDYTSVIWLAGDQSVADAALDHVEEEKLTAFVSGGCTLLLSGSDVGFDLARAGAPPNDRDFLANVLHAQFVGDSDPTRTAEGTPGGPLAGVSLAFGGSDAPYRSSSPDFLTPTAGAQEALVYGDGKTAGVASHSGVLYLGFPIETIDAQAQRDALVARTLDWQASLGD
jgi:hypothetical protein